MFVEETVILSQKEDRADRVVWPGWQTVRTIGRGSYGAVYEICRDLPGGRRESAAVKVVSIPRTQSEIAELRADGYDEGSISTTYRKKMESLTEEYSLMRTLNGTSNVVNCDDLKCLPHGDGIGWDIYIKMELLMPLTQALPEQMSEELVIRIGRDLCRALKLCENNNIVHRDIKPQNIFVSPNGDFKLGDFGIARTMDGTVQGTRIGTYRYLAPEVYYDRPYDGKVDI